MSIDKAVPLVVLRQWIVGRMSIDKAVPLVVLRQWIVGRMSIDKAVPFVYVAFAVSFRKVMMSRSRLMSR